MKNNKIYIVLLVILFVFFIVMFFLFGLKNMEQERYESTIIVGNSSVWTLKDKKWLNIRTKASLNEISWQKYHVYNNQEKIGEYDLWYSDEKWYAFDENKTAIPTGESLFAYRANYDLKVKYLPKKEVEDYTFVNQVLRENNIEITNQFSSIYKMKIDFDSDGIEEDFYIISNVFALDFAADNLFSMAFMVKNNKVYMIYSDITKNKYYNSCKPYYNAFLDINNDGIYEFILSCGKYSALEQVDMLYQYSNNEFKIIISNQ